jgi:hypothetical protein
MTANSVAMIAPAAQRDALNALGEALGYGPQNWNVPLSADGLPPATHWGTHLWEQPGGQFQQMRAAVQAGQTPPGLEAYAAALNAVSFRVAEASLNARANWDAALAAASLTAIGE